VPEIPSAYPSLKRAARAYENLARSPRFLNYTTVIDLALRSPRPITAKDIQRELDLRFVQLAYYYANRLVELGLLRKIRRGGRVYYAPTDLARDFVRLAELKASAGPRNSGSWLRRRPSASPLRPRTEKDREVGVRTRLHAAKAKFRIVRRGSDLPFLRKVTRMRNWDQETYFIPWRGGRLAVQVNTRRVVVSVPRPDAPLSPDEFKEWVLDAVEHVREVMAESGWELEFTGTTAEVGVKDPVAALVAREGVTLRDTVGAIDDSPGRGEGEFDIYDDPLNPERVKRYMLTVTEILPRGYWEILRRLEGLERRVDVVAAGMDKIAGIFERLLPPAQAQGQGRPEPEYPDFGY